MSKLAKLLLAATAFAPVLLIYALVSVVNSEYRNAAGFGAVCVLLVLACMWLLRFAKRHLQLKSYHTATVETSDNEIFNLLLIYLLPLITRELEDYNWITWIFVMFLFCLVVAVSYGYHFNPLLAFFWLPFLQSN